jgi:multidrug efflux pump subunit AcrB
MIYSITLKDSDNINTRRRVEKEIVPFIERINGVSLVDISEGRREKSGLM